MDYSTKIKSLFLEISTQRSYSRLHPVLRIIMVILMLPFIVAGALEVAMYYVLLFFRNGSKIALDELEAWLNKKKEGVHFLPEAILYLITIPFIFFLRVCLTVFASFLYFVWFWIMVCAYTATLGGIRWQPSLNTAIFDKEYVWDFKHSNTTFNVFVLINVGFILLCIIQAILNAMLTYAYVAPWLVLLTLAMIYLIYPQIFVKKNLREMSTSEEIYAVATTYAQVRCLANYTRASALMKKIPGYQDADELAAEYDEYIREKKNMKSIVGRILMLILGVIIVMLVIIPPVVEAISVSMTKDEDLVYIDNDGAYMVSCTDYSVKTADIEAKYKGEEVIMIAKSAFKGCDKLRSVEIPKTIQVIGASAFQDCTSLTEIKFEGTKEQWEEISKAVDWDKNTGDYVVKCTDGDIKKVK